MHALCLTTEVAEPDLVVRCGHVRGARRYRQLPRGSCPKLKLPAVHTKPGAVASEGLVVRQRDDRDKTKNDSSAVRVCRANDPEPPPTFADVLRVDFGLPVHFLGKVTIHAVLVLIFGVSALALAITAVGLWLLKRWAWVATMVLVGIGLFTGIWQVLLGRPLDITLLFNVIVVFYLNSRDVQNAFSRRTPTGESV